MDNVMSSHKYIHSVSGGQFNVFRHLKMHKSAGKPKRVLPYTLPYLSSITWGCVQNTSADAANDDHDFLA